MSTVHCPLVCKHCGRNPVLYGGWCCPAAIDDARTFAARLARWAHPSWREESRARLAAAGESDQAATLASNAQGGR